MIDYKQSFFTRYDWTGERDSGYKGSIAKFGKPIWLGNAGEPGDQRKVSTTIGVKYHAIEKS